VCVNVTVSDVCVCVRERETERESITVESLATKRFACVCMSVFNTILKRFMMEIFDEEPIYKSGRFFPPFFNCMTETFLSSFFQFFAIFFDPAFLTQVTKKLNLT
jgi:hypothetical protein